MSKTLRVKSTVAGVLFFILSVSTTWAADPNTVATPVFNPDGGTYNTEQNIIITCATSGATIRYTIDGSDPNGGTIIASGSSVFIDHSLTLKAKAWKDGFTSSSIKSSTYQLVVATPVFDPNGGVYESDQTVIITCVTPGAEIHYTTNSFDPNQSDSVISHGGSVVVSVDPPTILRARAWKTGFETSTIKTADYRQPKIIYVNTDATGANNGTSWTDAYIILQSALSAAGSGDEIWVAAGTYKPTSGYDLGADQQKHFRLKNGVALYGGFAGTETTCQQRDLNANETILSGMGYYYHVFYHPDGTNLDDTAILDGFTISNSHGGDYYGGGMYNSHSSPTICNCIFSNNSAYATYRNYYDPLYCPDCYIDVPCGAGGGMYNSQSNPILINCVFIDNTANGSGGGIYNYWYSNPVLINCTFTGNTPSGVCNDYSNPTITNCIFWGNSSPQIYNEDCTSVVTYSDIQGGYSGTGNISANPLFVTDPNEGIVLSLQAGSPCIDAGNNAALPAEVTTDLSGDLRFVDDLDRADTGSGTPPIVDMGVYEGKKVSRPVFAPKGGIYDTEQTVVITCATAGATIHYTTNGLDPTENDPVILSGSSVNINQNLTLKAKAWKENFVPSKVKSGYYQFDPFPIMTKAQLLAMAADSNNYNKYFILMAEIDLGGQVFNRAIIAPHSVIDWEGHGVPFTGIFDGNGHKITHFSVHGGSDDHLGLFGYIGSGGQIKNLSLENFSVTASSSEWDYLNYTSGLAGYNYGTISQCSVIGTVDGYYYVGGLAGHNRGNISNCYSTCIVSGSYDVGGLTGHNYGSIIQCYSTCTVSGSYDVGGLAGYNDGSINNCCTKGSIIGIDSSPCQLGGLVGYNQGGISNCYSTCSVSGYWRAGGIVGYTSNGIISNCYSNGAISGTLEIGGLAGGKYNSSITNSFWDTQTSGQTASAGGTGKTTIEMQDPNTFLTAGWDFVNETANGTNDYWRMCVNGVDYPRLNWESIEGDFVCPDGVSTEDLSYFIGRWLMDNCTLTNNYCSGVDIDTSGKVDLEDWVVFAEHWLEAI